MGTLGKIKVVFRYYPSVFTGINYKALKAKMNINAALQNGLIATLSPFVVFAVSRA